MVEKVLTEGCFAASHSTSAGDLEAQDTEMRDTDAGEETAEIDDPLAMEAFKQKYHSMSRAAEKAFPVSHPGESGNGTGTLLVPGWIRERAIEILFEESKTETESISSAILHCLLKVSCRSRLTHRLKADTNGSYQSTSANRSSPHCSSQEVPPLYPTSSRAYEQHSTASLPPKRK